MSKLSIACYGCGKKTDWTFQEICRDCVAARLKQRDELLAACQAMVAVFDAQIRAWRNACALVDPERIVAEEGGQ